MKNIKVFILSLIAILFLILAVLVNWLFLIISVIIMLFNQKELFKKEKKLR